jgi:hypothetical protein
MAVLSSSPSSGISHAGMPVVAGRKSAMRDGEFEDTLKTMTATRLERYHTYNNQSLPWKYARGACIDRLHPDAIPWHWYP